jgi:hypothetical protein
VFPRPPRGPWFRSATQKGPLLHFGNCSSRFRRELHVPGSTEGVLGSTGRAPGRTGRVPEHAGRVLGRPGTRPGASRARTGIVECVSAREWERPFPSGTLFARHRTQGVHIGCPCTAAAAGAAAAVAAAAVRAAAVGGAAVGAAAVAAFFFFKP